MGYRSETQFFHDGFVHEAVTSLSQLDSITIYVGAGATVDRTGLVWRALVERLLVREAFAERGYISSDDARMLCAALSPVEAATVAGFYYKSVYGPDWFPKVASDLRSVLYSGNSWRSGTFCTNVIRLAIAYAKLGKTIRLVTTNYETFLEQEFIEQAELLIENESLSDAKLPEFEVSVLGEHRRILTFGDRENGTISLTYLHGRIPPEGEGDPEGRIGLTEQDYFDLRADVLQVLEPMVATGGLLVLGSSLTDPPLLTALQATRPRGWEPDSSSRFALTPMPSYGLTELSDEQVEIMKNQLRSRMEVFGVTLLFPDFFFQVPQFCQEIVSALKGLASASAGYHERPEIRYGQRLVTWWRSWQGTHTNERDVEAAYDNLVEELRDIRQRLAPVRRDVPGSNRELLKLEVWVRWDPTDTNRDLGLWAVSTGVRRDFQSIRRPALDVASDFEAVRCFTSGAPRLTRESVTPATSTEHPWHTVLSVPISYTDPAGNVVPVGVINLAGSEGGGRSRIEIADAAKMQELVQSLGNRGRELLATDAPPTIRQRTWEADSQDQHEDQ